MVARTVGIVIGTFGSDDWDDRGAQLARRIRHDGSNCVHCHADTLAEARNYGALMLSSHFVSFLDADDDLVPGYADAMSDAVSEDLNHVILQPSTRGRVDGVLDDFPLLIPHADLYRRNYLVIGSAVNRLDFIAINGFRDLPALEDWDLFIRLVINGAIVKSVSEAVYIVNVHLNSRNTNSDVHGQVYRQIQSEYAGHATVLRDHTHT